MENADFNIYANLCQLMIKALAEDMHLRFVFLYNMCVINLLNVLALIYNALTALLFVSCLGINFALCALFSCKIAETLLFCAVLYNRKWFGLVAVLCILL